MLYKYTAQFGSWHALNFKTQLCFCPCGMGVPCPQHGEFTERFWEVSSDQPDYIDEILAKKLPYTAPHHVIREQHQQQKRLERQNPNATPHDPEAARTDHAQRRCAAYLPLKPGETTAHRDTTWIDECPCGAKLHCYQHPIWSKVRYLKPWHPDYAVALKHSTPPFTRRPRIPRRPTKSHNDQTNAGEGRGPSVSLK